MTNDKERIWVKQFGKYMDELTNEEWTEMTNAHCDDPLKNCDIPEPIKEDKK